MYVCYNILNSTFTFRVEKILNPGIFDNKNNSSFWGNYFTSKRENRMSFERRTSKTSKKRTLRWKSRNASFVSPPPFFHGFWHTGNRAGVRVCRVFFFSFFNTLSTCLSDRFLFPLLGEFSSPGVKRCSVKRGLSRRRHARRTWTSTFTAGCSFRSVKRVVLRGGRAKKNGVAEISFNKEFFNKRSFISNFSIGRIWKHLKFCWELTENYAGIHRTAKRSIDPLPVKCIMTLWWRNKLFSRYTLYRG